MDGLQQIESEIESGAFAWKEELEDIHMNVESRLFELIGDAAGRLHTGRSRNDQVATDSRLYAMRAARDALRAVRLTQRALLKQASDHFDTVLPAYTHLQRGQPVTLTHHLLAYFEMLDRDAVRFAAARDAADVSPLGSGAMAGVPYPLDRKSVATELGFHRHQRQQHGRRVGPRLHARFRLRVCRLHDASFAPGRGTDHLVF